MPIIWPGTHWVRGICIAFIFGLCFEQIGQYVRERFFCPNSLGLVGSSYAPDVPWSAAELAVDLLLAALVTLLAWALVVRPICNWITKVMPPP